MLPDEEKKAKASPHCEKVPCRFCGTEITYDLTNYSRRQLVIFRLTKLPAPGEMYRDERVYAATLFAYFEKYRKAWVRLAFKSPDELEEELRARTERAKAKKEVKPSREQLRYKELEKRAYEFYGRVSKEEEERYGPAKHKLAEEVQALKTVLPENIKTSYYTPIKLPEKAARNALFFSSVVAKLEIALWGTPRTSVSADVHKFSKAVQAFDDERAREERERMEAEAKRKAEREAEEERRKAEREAASAESLNRW